MILETFTILNATVLASKMIYKGVIDYHATYTKIVNNGLYHITSKENAFKIMASETLNPSGHINSLGVKKVFFFAGIPSLNELSSNAAFELNNETLYAIKVTPSHEEMINFKTRIYNDQAITYEGQYKLNKNSSKIVELIYDYDENNNTIIREKNEMEYKNYQQPNDIKHKLKGNSEFLTTLKGLGISYFREFKSLGELLKTNSLSLINKPNKSDLITQLKEEKEKLHTNNIMQKTSITK